MKITLATLPQATAQQVFDQVAEHLLRQGKASTGELGCQYRGDNGLMCAAGCLMSDEEYKRSFEESAWGYLVKRRGITAVHEELICRLQDVHDQCSADGWHNTLLGVAADHNLSPAVVTNFKVQS